MGNEILIPAGAAVALAVLAGAGGMILLGCLSWLIVSGVESAAKGRLRFEVEAVGGSASASR